MGSVISKFSFSITLLTIVTVLFMNAITIDGQALAEEKLIDYRHLIQVRLELGWLADMDKYDTDGRIDAYFPLYRFPEDGVVYFDITQNVPFQNISGTTRFVVPEIDYGLEGGLAKRIKSNLLGSLFYRRQGLAKFDNLGDQHLHLIGLSLMTEDYLVKDISLGWKWKVSASGSLDKRDMAGGTLLEGDFIYNLWQRGGVGLSLEGETRTLITSSHLRMDLEAGPKLSFYGSQGTINSIVARYINTRTPLGKNDNGYYLGVMVENGAPFKEEKEIPSTFMDYGGTITFGYGEAGRTLMDINLLGNIPTVSEGYEGLTFAYEAQSFYLTGSSDNLYYITIAGLEKDWQGYDLGFYFNHRSGHLLNDSYDFGKDDLNVYELGISSPGWHLYRQKEKALSFGRLADWGRVNFLLRLGMNADNTFVSKGHLDTKIGFRLDWDKKIFNLIPSLSNYDELIGQALLHDTSLGLRRNDGWVYSLKYRYDDQISASKNGALLLTVGKVF